MASEKGSEFFTVIAEQYMKDQFNILRDAIYDVYDKSPTINGRNQEYLFAILVAQVAGAWADIIQQHLHLEGEELEEYRSTLAQNFKMAMDGACKMPVGRMQ